MIYFKNLTIGYDRHPVIHHIHAHINKGDFVALVGPNGSGKSTLIKSLTNEIKPLEGYLLNNCKSYSYIPQINLINRNFPIKVKDYVSFGLYKNKGLFKFLTKEDKKNIKDSLKLVRMENYENSYIDTLSGGQFQRIIFSRVYLENSELIILDEPFSAIDMSTTNMLMKILKNWNKIENKTILIVMHDLNLINDYIDKTMILAREIIAYGNTKEVLNEKNIKEAFQKDLFIDPDAKICNR